MKVNLTSGVAEGVALVNLLGQANQATAPAFFADAYQNPVVTTWTSATTLNTAVQFQTAGMDTVALTIAPGGSITGGTITFQVYDGASWINVKCARLSSYNTDSAFNMAGSPGLQGWTVPAAGYPQFQFILTGAIMGTGNVVITSIVSSAPDTSICTVGVDPLSTLPPYASNTITNGLGQYRYFTPASTAVQTIKSSAGKVHRINCVNGSASARYLKLYNNAAPTVGTTTPFKTFLIPASSQIDINADMYGLYFSTAITCSITGALIDTDTTAPAANDVLTQIEYI